MGQGKSALDLFRGDRVVADQYFDQMDYKNAIHFYEKVLDKKPKDLQSKYRIAQSHLHLNAPQTSEVWLRSLTADPNSSVEMKIFYAEVLRRNGKADEAIDWYTRVLAEGENHEIASKLEFLTNLSYYLRDSVYELSNLSINTELSEFALQPYGKEMIFLSSRQTEKYIQHQPANAINEDEGMLRYFTLKDNQITHLIYSDEAKPYYHDGPLSIYNEGKSVAFTRNNLKDASRSKGITRLNLKLFLADVSGSTNWTNITPFKYNSDNYSVGHPAVLSNGLMMYFSSDMPGGYGGADLYVTKFENNEWSTPQNLGPKVNTSENELFPTLLNDTTLYFASSGLGGFGGLDIFTARIVDEGVIEPKNMGTPINSPADDFSMLMDTEGRKGFFSSNRANGKGLDDIYEFKTIMFSAVGKVVTKQTKVPIANAEVIINAQNGVFQVTTITDSLGIFRMDLPYDEEFRLTSAAEEHSPIYRVPYSTDETKISYDTLTLELWEHELYAKGRLFSNETQELIPEVLVTIENIDNGLKDSITTRSDGTYSFPLAPNMHYRINASHEGFLSKGFTINTKELFTGDLLNDIVLEEEYEDKLVIYFDFNKSEISSNDRKSFKELLRTLRRFPESILNIGAHADSRGTETYNKKLSEERLRTVVSYFRRNGIPMKRIHGLAFGEELPLNQCSSGVECPEEDHSKNRRAELKVQMNAIH